MVLPSLIVIHVPCEFTLCVFLLHQLILEVFIVLLFLIDVTSIITTSPRSMILPLAFTKPAKIIVAVSAMNVVATLVLLDEGATTGTWLGVGLKPSEVLIIILFFICPGFYL